MTPLRTPPKLLEACVRRALGADARGESIVGDLREEYAQISKRRGRWAGMVWYLTAGLGTALRVMVGRAREGRRGWVGSVGRDISHAARSLLREPLFFFATTVTLALGIGATTAIYSVLSGILLEPLPYREPAELIDISNNTGGAGWYGSSPAQFLDYEERVTSIEAIGGWTTGTRIVGDLEASERVSAAFFTAGLWATLGVPAIDGRWFTPDEDVLNEAPVVLISERYWTSRLGGRPDVVGSTLTSNGSEVEIVGVMPADFSFPNSRVDLWFPFRMNRDTPTRSNHFVNVVARLASGNTVADARAEIASVARWAVEQYPANYSERGYRTRVVSLHEATIGEVRTGVWVATASAALVLLVALVNAMNLLLARGDRRRREFAIRTALGAPRLRVVRQLFTETTLLVGVGAGAGILLSKSGVDLLIALAPAATPRIDNVSLDGSVLLFSLLLVGGAAFLLGLAPAMRASKAEVGAGLASGDRRSVGPGRTRLRGSLVAAQITFATILAIGAGVLIRSVDNLYSEDAGFEADGVMAMRVDLPPGRYGTPIELIDAFNRIEEALDGAPGVARASIAQALPLQGQYGQLSIDLEGEPRPELGAAKDAYFQLSSGGYFDAMGIEPSEGRVFDEEDRLGAPLVAVANDAFVRTFYSDGSGVGKRVRMWSDGSPWFEIVGVIPDIREAGLDQSAAPQLYLPYAQTDSAFYGTPAAMYMVLRADSDASESLTETARAVINRAEPGAPISDVQSMEARVADSLVVRRFARFSLQLFGVVALILAGIGVYGVLALSVGERRREIGLRKALGAGFRRVALDVVRDSLRVVAGGAAVGLVAGVIASRAMSSLLYGVSAWDPFVLGVVALVVTLIGAAAAGLPAIEAGRVEPLIALRED